MSIADELRNLGYKLEYEYGDSEDRTEVWVNKKAGMAVRIEWMRIDEEGWRAEGERSRRLPGAEEPPQAVRR